MMAWGVILNISLISFNLLPIPPLDGSHVMKYLLPRPLAIRYVQFGRYGILVLVVLVFMGQGVLQAWFRPAALAIERIIVTVSPYLVPPAMQWLQ
jgi:Zn-dependent protease